MPKIIRYLNFLFFFAGSVMGIFSWFLNEGFSAKADDSRFLSTQKTLEKKIKNWTVLYHNNAAVSDLLPYDLIVLDANTDLSPFSLYEHKKQVFGYVSLAEVRPERRYFKKLKEADGIFIRESASWPGSYLVDVRDKRWVLVVIEEIIPELLQKGFRGLFLDTLDSAEALEIEDPKKFAGMQQAAVDLVEAIKVHYPEINLIQNRGYRLLSKTAPYLQYAVFECLHSCWDFKKERYFLRSEADVEWQKNFMPEAVRANKKLQFLSLDYWEANEAQQIKKLYARARADKFTPYVATISLDKLVREP